MNVNLRLPNIQINFQKICRTCLTENDSLGTIFRIIDLLKECTSIQVDMEDDLPKLICLECTNKLNNAFLFRKQCELSEKTLLQLREFKETPVKHETENLETNETDIKSEGAYNINEDILETCNEKDTFKINDVSCDFDDQTSCGKLINENADLIGEHFDCKISNQNSDASINLKKNKCNKKLNVKNPKLKIKINNELKVKIDNDTIKNNLECLQCKKSFQLEIDLEIHMLKHQKFDELICPKCSKSFASRHNLRRHLNTHMVTKPFKCKFCDKSFAGPGDRNRHLRLHTGEKPYICPTCGKPYADGSGLSKHMKYHNEVKDFACTICSKSFVFPNALRIHMRVHTGEKPYLCTECGDSFKSCFTLKSHERKHTGEPGSFLGDSPFCCNICGKILKSNQSLSQHRKTHSKGK